MIIKPLISIITVNYNNTNITADLLRSIVWLEYANIEVIVVDNGSAENPTEKLKNILPSTNIILSEKNLGFAGGNNLGIKAAKGDYLFFVNNDTEVTADLIGTLVNTLDTHHEVGIISPKIRYHDDPGMLQYAGYTPMNYYTARNKCIGQYEQDNGQYDIVTGATGYLHGAAMMLRREAIEKAGSMPETYFLYYEEMDWSEQVMRA